MPRVTAAGLDPLERGRRRRRRWSNGSNGRAERYAANAAPTPIASAVPPAAAEAALCAARLAMWRADLPPGNRNNVAIRLASAFRLAGYTRAQSLDLLYGNGPRGRRRHCPAQEIESVAHSAYRTAVRVHLRLP